MNHLLVVSLKTLLRAVLLYYCLSNIQTTMNNITIQIQLVKVREKRFNLQTDNSILKILREQNLQVGMNVLITPNLSDNQIILQITINYHYTENAVLITPLFYIMEIWFSVIDLDRFVEEKGETILIKHELLSMLLGISIGTIRGMIAHRCQDTIFEAYPLPIINITHLRAHLQKRKNIIEDMDIAPNFLSRIH